MIYGKSIKKARTINKLKKNKGWEEKKTRGKEGGEGRKEGEHE